MSDQLLYLNNLPLLFHKKDSFSNIPGFDNYKTIASFFDANIGLYDRSGGIIFPFNIKNTDPIPKFEKDFRLSYKECAMARMSDLDFLHCSTGKKFRLMYSGGVDSSAIFASFVEFYGLAKTRDVLEICCSKESIDENPWLWDQYIRKENFDIINSYNHNHYWFDNKITLIGEGNDQLFGRTDYAHFKGNKDLYCKITVEELARYLDRSGKKPGAQYTAKMLIRSKDTAPFNIDNLCNLIWWYYFSLAWNGLMYRVLGQINSDILPKDVLESGLVQFYNSKLFQQWSMKFHYDYADSFLDLNNYRADCKDLILDILDIPHYREKAKFQSFPRLQLLKSSTNLIDTELNIYNSDSDYMKFVLADNDFSNT